MVHGKAEYAFRSMDPRRFGAYATHDYIVERAREDFEIRHYTPVPGYQHSGECVLFDGRPVGMVSSGGYGHRTSRSYAFAFVEPRLARPGTALEVVILEEARVATVLDGAAYDPMNRRIRS